MKKLSRREFLKFAATGTGGLLLQQLLTACGIQTSPAASTPTFTAAGVTSTASASAGLSSSTTTELAPLPDLVVVRNGEPEALVRAALQALGGMTRFVPAGARVVVKPNICTAYNTFEYASTTNPWVVGALVKLCFEAGAASVTVLDFPFGGTAEAAYQKSGIKEQVEAAGGRMEVMGNLKYSPVTIPGAGVLTETKAYQDALDADVLINVPIAKQHGSTKLTLGMKNLMGLVQNRNNMHHLGLHQAIADLATLFRPELTVVDAVRILTANGPTGGNLADVQKLDTIVVSPDIVAADAYTTRFFGKTPADIGYIQAGADAGLGRLDLENMLIDEIDLVA